MQISKREKHMLAAVGILAVLAAVYMLYYQPAVREAKEALAQVDSEQQNLQQMIAKGEENERLSEEISLMQEELVSALERLPEANDEPGLIKHLHHMFAPFGGKESIHIEDPVVFAEFSKVRVSLSYEVSYAAFKLLLAALETSHYKNRLDSFTVQMQQGQVENAVMTDIEQIQQGEVEEAVVPDMVQIQQVEVEDAVMPDMVQIQQVEVEEAVVPDTVQIQQVEGEAFVVADMALTFYFSN